jgi:hypothetical protein
MNLLNSKINKSDDANGNKEGINQREGGKNAVSLMHLEISVN